MGRMLEEGVGDLEDLVQAYRFYLLASKNGHEGALPKRVELHETLSPKQLKLATCFAKYGTQEISWVIRKKCEYIN